MGRERVLIVDDEPGVRSALEGILADEGYDVTTADSGESGLEATAGDPFDAILLDVWLPGMDGLEALKRLREISVDAEVVMISGHGSIETAVRATKLGAFDFVEKPLSLEKTLLVLRNALRQRRLARMNSRLLEQLSRDTEIIGASAAARGLRREIEIAAASTAPALVVGESGSGRETVARRVHATAMNADAPFVEVPCAALGSGRLVTVLMGEADRPGRVALAAGGSLFLEDIDRLDDRQRAQLADLIPQIEALDRSPRLLASAGGPLGAPLAARLEVLTLHVPPLRERREDVPLFLERFLRELSREYARDLPAVSREALEALRLHDWPGNVRELRNLTERLLLFGGNPIEIADLPEVLGGRRPPAEDLYRTFGSLAEGVAAFEGYYVRRVLAECDGDRAAAAQRLGLEVEELNRRLAGA